MKLRIIMNKEREELTAEERRLTQMEEKRI
jgi:hypothetical protein